MVPIFTVTHLSNDQCNNTFSIPNSVRSQFLCKSLYVLFTCSVFTQCFFPSHFTHTHTLFVIRHITTEAQCRHWQPHRLSLGQTSFLLLQTTFLVSGQPLPAWCVRNLPHSDTAAKRCGDCFHGDWPLNSPLAADSEDRHTEHQQTAKSSSHKKVAKNYDPNSEIGAPVSALISWSIKMLKVFLQVVVGASILDFVIKISSPEIKVIMWPLFDVMWRVMWSLRVKVQIQVPFISLLVELPEI